MSTFLCQDVVRRFRPALHPPGPSARGARRLDERTGAALEAAVAGRPREAPVEGRLQRRGRT